ncbi:hypothetical protein TSTA_001630 [Talaromyces stipitatus ATCC 10500]|uniref:Uncharacterized protein n=1 Tax=Talaromyces stipitatus (strain ATCC 10500 / CBS 375.48 / QM 6759 / NRRL 1006) TaxID=441959 RepID=B8MSX7_TALSN|nr:uncharacterized protein TSTA_001630 [Talaromyces stipitatus ATCC 10500]EED12092.1 hypothetical protein TSTA_001630 [Talaromyces stipitatus ATCC 10500]
MSSQTVSWLPYEMGTLPLRFLILQESNSIAASWTRRLYSEVTHVGRVSGARLAELNGVSEDQPLLTTLLVAPSPANSCLGYIVLPPISEAAFSPTNCGESGLLGSMDSLQLRGLMSSMALAGAQG